MRPRWLSCVDSEAVGGQVQRPAPQAFVRAPAPQLGVEGWAREQMPPSGLTSGIRSRVEGGKHTERRRPRRWPSLACPVEWQGAGRTGTEPATR
jgi:hypothetical protein